MTLDALRALFPSAQTCIHLNHAGTSPIARPVADAVATVTAELMSENSFVAYVNHQKRQENLRARLARMLHTAPETLAFVRNTSHGLSIVADALPLHRGDTVVVPANEYPANVYPWMAQRKRGVETRLVAPQENGLLSEDDLIAACDEKTRVLAVSWVHWGTGQRLDLRRLGTFCRARGIYFAVDLVQGLGALTINLADLPIDFAAAGCHKWLLAPGGVGVLYVHPERLHDLAPTNIGWNSVTHPIEWENIHFDLKPATERFEEGTPNILGIAALDQSVQLLEKVGFEAVDRRVRTLADQAHQRLAERGYTVISPENDEARSGIVAFRHPTLPQDAVLETLTHQKIIAAVRCGNLRFAPHAYTTEAEIETAVAALPRG